jgi:hypothetical protein
MQNWNIIRPIVAQILQQQHYTGSGNYNGTRCFITAYQIAVLADRNNPTIRGALPIGGRNVGFNDSFAKQIAGQLSKEVNNGTFPGLEIGFLSIEGLDSFTFDGGHIPSNDEFSMFRLVQ